MAWSYLVSRAIKEPHLIFPAFLALLNGFLHRLKFLLTFKKAKIGKFFRVYGTCSIYGNGKVEIGDNCVMIGDVFGKVTLLTDVASATIKLGDHVTLNGTVVQCNKEIIIGDWTIMANAFIVDSQGHHMSIDRRFQSHNSVLAKPIRIEKNVWISSYSIVSYGVTIGENSVIGAMTLIREDVPASSFYAGNPARFIKKVPEKHDDFDFLESFKE